MTPMEKCFTEKLAKTTWSGNRFLKCKFGDDWIWSEELTFKLTSDCSNAYSLKTSVGFTSWNYDDPSWKQIAVTFTHLF